ncbi:Hypothetical protein, secreted [Salinibacter ruber M8]|uniref:Uncharacterized protein n=1 Tax=Salinibacter ruber (strain M8) TaxID=761659 RepID=D5H4W2_SALRM|nr:Hypothetical protein, secreted [Salinibacter ruber M8]
MLISKPRQSPPSASRPSRPEASRSRPAYMSEFLGGLSLSLRALSPRQALSPSAPAPETVHSIERRWRSGTPGGQGSGGITPPQKSRGDTTSRRRRARDGSA